MLVAGDIVAVVAGIHRNAEATVSDVSPDRKRVRVVLPVFGKLIEAVVEHWEIKRKQAVIN